MSPRTTRKDRQRRKRLYLVLVSVMALSLLLVAVLERRTVPGPEPAAPPSHTTAVDPGPPKPKTATPVAERTAPPPAPVPAAAGPTVKVAIIIDDVGYDAGLDDQAAAIPFPLTYSVLPGLDSSAVSAARLRKAGCEIMLHLPMEPQGYPEKNPGPGALFTFMSPAEIRDTIRRDIRSVPGAKGVNNHMGSLFTTREDLLGVVFEELRHHGFYFVDSRTTTETAARRVARRYGVETGRRSVFLDNEEEPAVIIAQLEQLFRVALRERSAIGIGHYRKGTLDVLAAEVPVLLRRHPAVRMVHASAVVE